MNGRRKGVRETEKDRQTGRQTDRQTDRDRQTDMCWGEEDGRHKETTRAQVILGQWVFAKE